MLHKRLVYITLFTLFFIAIGAVSVIAENQNPESCVNCHEGATRDWERGSKSEFMLCVDCHGEAHTGPGNAHLVEVPTPKDCAVCHPQEVERFEEGKHAYAWEAMLAVPTFQDMPKAATDKGCVVCHQIGYEWDDGSRGRCDSCHSRHVFSAEEAREPESCGHCHTGDHPQYEMWQSSKHGMIYAIEQDPERAPTCVTCHMPEGDHFVMTAWGFLGVRGEEPDAEWEADREKILYALNEMGPARAPEVMRETMGEWEELREQMIDICSQCHATSYAQRDLEKSDALLREADRVNAQIVDLTNQFYEEGLIDERTRFNTFRDATANRFATYMGAFHNSPLYAWDKGFLALTSDMVYLRDDLIQEKKLDIFGGKIKQSLFLGGTALVIAAGLLAFTVVTVKRKKKEEGSSNEKEKHDDN